MTTTKVTLVLNGDQERVVRRLLGAFIHEHRRVAAGQTGVAYPPAQTAHDLAVAECLLDRLDDGGDR